MLNSEVRIAELLIDSGFVADIDVYQQIAAYLAANGTYCLPFRIGDDAWTIEDGDLGDGRIYEIGLGNNSDGDLNAFFMADTGWSFELQDIGKTVFHTEEEAEAALKAEGATDDGKE